MEGGEYVGDGDGVVVGIVGVVGELGAVGADGVGVV